MTQSLKNVKSDTKYKLVFDAKAEDDKAKMEVLLARSKEWSKGHYGMKKQFRLTNDWKTYTLNFKSSQIEKGNTPQLKFFFGFLKGEVSFRRIRLSEATDNVELSEVKK